MTDKARPNRGKTSQQVINEYIDYNQARTESRQSDVTRHVVGRATEQAGTSQEKTESRPGTPIPKPNKQTEDLSFEELRLYRTKTSESSSTTDSGNGNTDQNLDDNTTQPFLLAKPKLILRKNPRPDSPFPHNPSDNTADEETGTSEQLGSAEIEDSDSEPDDLNKTIVDTSGTPEKFKDALESPTLSEVENTSTLGPSNSGDQIDSKSSESSPNINNIEPTETMATGTNSMFPFLLAEVPNFSGKEMPLAQYIERIDEMLSMITDPDETIKFVKWIRVKLIGRAKGAVSAADATTWQAIKDALSAEMTQPVSTQSCLKQLSMLRQNEGETIESFGERVKQQLSVLNNSYGSTISAVALTHIRTENAKIAQTVFEDGIRNTFLKMGVMNSNKTSLAESIHEAMDKEPRWTKLRHESDKRVKQCNVCGKLGHLEEECRIKAAGKGQPKCDICKREGHSKNECQYRPSTSDGWKKDNNKNNKFNDKNNNNKYSQGNKNNGEKDKPNNNSNNNNNNNNKNVKTTKTEKKEPNAKADGSVGSTKVEVHPEN